ncbi:hypothetical protein P4282_24095 [Bacillus swezeyi]|uniref:hypothetical protein n=1 Tax=Bacillus swezeyi TaxID=1925020 RepID=UPI002E210DCF|nr:hypothetical protein [Bacillus swezeyi]
MKYRNYYDFEVVKRIISEKRDSIDIAELGLKEDWDGTSEVIFRNGEYSIELNDYTMIYGIQGSSKATPALRLTYLDGNEEQFDCSDKRELHTYGGILPDFTFEPVKAASETEAAIQMIKQLRRKLEGKISEGLINELGISTREEK